MEDRFPAAAFFALLVTGFLCLFVALRAQPNYGAMPAYRDDPAYLVTSGVFLKLQTLSNAIATGNKKTMSQIQTLLKGRKLPKQ